jgi:DME family drug/metabolite transporter
VVPDPSGSGDDQRGRAVVAALCSALLFGTSGTILVNAPRGADAWSVGCVRLAIGGLTLALGAHWRHRSLAEAWSPSHRRSTAVGAVGVAVFQLGYFLAVERTGVAIGTVVTIGSGPVLTGLIEAVRTHRRPAVAWLAGTALSVGGVALLGTAGRATHTDPAGVALAVGAGLGWAVFSAVGKHQIDAGVRSTGSMAAIFCGGAVLVAPALLWHSPTWVGSARGVSVAVCLGVLTVGVAYTSYGWALRHLPAPTVITLTLLEPITASLLAAVVVHEGIRAAGWAGVALVLVGLTVTARSALP